MPVVTQNAAIIQTHGAAGAGGERRQIADGGLIRTGSVVRTKRAHPFGMGAFSFAWTASGIPERFSDHSRDDPPSSGREAALQERQ